MIKKRGVIGRFRLKSPFLELMGVMPLVRGTPFVQYAYRYALR